MKIVRNILIAIVAVVLLFVGLIFYSFSRTMPLKNLQPLSGGAFQIKAGFVSVGIIPSGDHQVIMVDCGNDAKAKDILASLAQVGLSQDSVRTILITHDTPGPHCGLRRLSGRRSLCHGSGTSSPGRPRCFQRSDRNVNG